MNDSTLAIAVIGAGPVGLALALHAARTLPRSAITLFDARAADKDVSGDPRTLALSLGSVQLLERLGAWRADLAQPILEVHVSQQAPSLPPFLSGVMGEPALRIRARDEGVPLLGAVLSYGHIVAPLQAAWQAAAQASPERLHSPLRHAGRGAEEPGRRRRGRCRHRRALRSGDRRRRRRLRRPGAQGSHPRLSANRLGRQGAIRSGA